MDVSEDISGTLRAQDHGHPPVVMAAGFCTEHSAKSRSIGYEDETSPTLRAGVVPAAIALEHHPTDSRIRIEEGDAIQTLTSRMGTGGNNVPLIMAPEGPLVPYTLKIRCGKEGGGKGALVQEDKSATLATNNDQTLFAPSLRVETKSTVGAGDAMVAGLCDAFITGKTPDQVLGEPRKGLKFVFSGDTAVCDTLIDAAKDADLLIAEATYGENGQAQLAIDHGHMNFAQAAAVASRSGARQLWLAHYSQMIEDPEMYLPNAAEIFPETHCGKGGMKTSLQLER